MGSGGLKAGLVVHWSGRWLLRITKVDITISDGFGERRVWRKNNKKGHDEQNGQMILLRYKYERICIRNYDV